LGTEPPDLEAVIPFILGVGEKGSERQKKEGALPVEVRRAGMW